jgi:F420-dependent methylenetetrahydromethanopterin dehydrogenase
VYDLKHTGTMTAAPRLAIKDNVLVEAQQYDDPYRWAAALLWH